MNNEGRVVSSGRLGRRKGLNFSDVTLVSDDDIEINVDNCGNFRLH